MRFYRGLFPAAANWNLDAELLMKEIIAPFICSHGFSYPEEVKEFCLWNFLDLSNLTVSKDKLLW